MTSEATKSPLTAHCVRARTFLFVHGNRPERFEKAVRIGADAIALDLEDSVPPAGKAAAQGGDRA